MIKNAKEQQSDPHGVTESREEIEELREIKRMFDWMIETLAVVYKGRGGYWVDWWSDATAESVDMRDEPQPTPYEAVKRAMGRHAF